MEEMLVATAAAEDSHYWFKGLRRQGRRWLDTAIAGMPVRRIIDCGAGTGRNLDWLSDLGPSVGVELTPYAISVGRAKGRRLVRGTVAALPFGDSSATITTSFDVFVCLPDEAERAAVEEMYRVLEPGGIALVNAAAFDCLKGSHSILTHEIRRYTRDRIARRLQAGGFEIERLSYTNFSLFPPTYAVRAWQRLSGKASQSSTSDLAVPPALVNDVLDAVLQVESKVLDVTDLPFGTSVMALARKPRRG